MSLTQVESDAQDLTQQTFYLWASKGHQLRDPSKVKSWLFTTLHRTFLRAQRTRRRFSHHNLEEVEEELPVVPPKFGSQADHSKVLTALTEVDKAYRAAVELFYLEDYSRKEIATILDVPIGTVNSRIVRGLAQLRFILLSNNSSVSSLPARTPWSSK
jgi:RNA polymerase sigma-70 factor (ECF subfamily)